MRKQVQRLAMITTLAIGASALSVAPALAIPTAQDQDHHDQYQKDQTEHPEYAKNQFYQLGNKEGYEDHKKNLQRTNHSHNYKTDEDKKAHDYGYQQGWQGKDYHAQHPDSH
jgi:hypothetical protein